VAAFVAEEKSADHGGKLLRFVVHFGRFVRSAHDARVERMH
jgi:hypothetical protein